MYICSFRMDDISPDMNWETFYKIKSIFDKYEVKPLIGIVPDNKDPKLSIGEHNPDFWEIIRELKKNGWSIAQHGYQHIYDSSKSGILRLKESSEFAGHSYEKQNDKIQKGREILQKHEIYANIFMAPGHTFDQVTLRVLRNHSFRYVTDGYSTCCYIKQSLIHIPCRKSEPKLERGIDTICLHCNHMSAKSIMDLELFIKEKRTHVVNYSDLLIRKASKYNLFIFLQEEKNLLIRKLKKNIAGNQRIHLYLEETDDSLLGKKILKRIAGIPRLLFCCMAKK